MCIVMMLSTLLTGCRGRSDSEEKVSYVGESFADNFNTPIPAPTPTPTEIAEKLSTQEALRQKKNMLFVRADAKTDIIGDNEIQNILLVGQDRRKTDKNPMRSDAMMIFSINTNTNQISLTSLMRDMYVPWSNGKEGLLNATYMEGGISLLTSTIEKDFGVHIDHYLSVDFWNFMDLFKVLGNVGIDLNHVEVSYLNGDGQKLREAYDGAGDGQKTWSLKDGLNSLDPEQLLTYCRTRAIGNGDWERTARERKVIRTVFTMLMGETNSSLIRLVRECHKYFTTDLTESQMLGYLYNFRTRAISQINDYRIPVDGSYTQETKETEQSKNKEKEKDKEKETEKLQVLVPHLDSNRNALQQYINGK